MNSFYERGAKVKTIHIKNKKTKTISLLIIPHSKEVRQINVATWIPRFSLCLVSMILLIFVYSSYKLYDSYNSLRQDYSEKIHKLSTLEELSQQQKNEIDSLRLMTAEVQEKLDSINDLQETVRNLVGLEETFGNSQENKLQSKDIFPSRGGPSYRRNNPTNFDKSDFEIQINELSSLLDKSSEELNILINDVEDKLKYLDAKPNLMPTTGKITSGFGYRKNPFGRGREFHSGIDIGNNSGTKIKAAGSGVVTFAGYNSGYGRYLIISHGYGYQSVYGHNRKLLVKVGDKVKKGQIISEMGSSGRSTGPHLHFEIKLNGNPIDPMKVINNTD